MLAITVDEPPGIAREAAVRLEQRLYETGCQMRLQLAELVRVQHLELDAVPAHQLPLERAALEALLGLVDLEPADRAQHVMHAGQRRKLAVGVVRLRQDGRQRRGALVDLGRAARQQEPHEPRREARQIAPAEPDRARGVEQHRRDLFPEIGRAGRRHRARDDAAGVAIGGERARRAGIDHADLVAVALQIERGAHADDAGTDHRNRASPHERSNA